ncbi:hypothetical protein F4703DRAFT_1794977 [Phycomyces blakesleeanus]|uniref:CYP509 protein n=1 Tax=Phycomyces blakesleeanus (strain ATCC 8743b / DSM 1359 / FGSC 10004 / NBRC 33097 / NRRL 1555) TaxID=763407 RepID=A0A167N5P1_PHYB8|nr:CYP509 protein [Phycomyces blakesleeanus NRRL 1555(-)]OAD75064.1 CYP509 protein [Phycomyces blakesleeanus NRRL 1555(-)]|eukprot:XP_018293104.1 CYP509 protein [Phycomyces blakesleeanus NRRL 1555(-)]
MRWLCTDHMNDFTLPATHDTTENAQSLAIYYLARNLEIQHRERKNVINISGEDKQDIIPSVDQTKGIIYIKMPIKATLGIKEPILATLTQISLGVTVTVNLEIVLKRI